jgi:hypothetical protein
VTSIAYQAAARGIRYQKLGGTGQIDDAARQADLENHRVAIRNFDVHTNPATIQVRDIPGGG